MMKQESNRSGLLSSVAALVVLGLLSGFQSRIAAAQSDPRAIELARKVMTALGGEEAWTDTRYIRFTFAEFRTHYWDKYSGRHRLEGRTREGDSFVVLHNLNTRQGEVYVNERRLSEGESKEWLDRAYAAWINDTYWLLMPYKLLDPGVTLGYGGTERIDNVTYERLELSFAQVGLTPGDRYWVFIHPATHLVERWAYILESQDPEGPATHWAWGGWKRYGNILLASERVNPETGRQLPLTEIGVFAALPDSVFASIQPVILE